MARACSSSEVTSHSSSTQLDQGYITAVAYKSSKVTSYYIDVQFDEH